MLRTISTHPALKTAWTRSIAARVMLPAATTVGNRALFSTTQVSHQATAHDNIKNVASNIPKDFFREALESRPIPMREEFLEGQKLTTEALEKLDFGPGKHLVPRTFGDKSAYYIIKFLRTLPDTYFGRNHYMRAMMLETVAAVPGMVGAMLRHMKSLRNMTEDGGWISHLLHEAENERFHLICWIKCAQPNFFNRLLVLGVQGIFFNAYFMLYLMSPKTAHRMCGYLEEEAVKSYTHFLDDIDAGIIKNAPAPKIAIDYYNLHPTATVRDVVLAVRADEAVHRDCNHFLSDRIAQNREDIISEVKEEYEKEASRRGHAAASSFA